MTTTDREVENRLQQHQVRYTTGRRAVINSLAGAPGPRSAAELHAEIGTSVPLSSLYRSLTVLEEFGVVQPHFGAKGITRYELAEWLKGHHHHLICINCGSVDDIELPHPIEQQVRALVGDIGSMASFMPINHALEIEGRCGSCL
jgi:Fe2+ or Zn2+ uptake regulation protein